MAQSSNITADSSILFARIERETSSRWRLSYVEVKPFIIVTKISWESTGKISAHKHWFVNKCAKHWNITRLTRLCLVVSVTVKCLSTLFPYVGRAYIARYLSSSSINCESATCILALVFLWDSLRPLPPNAKKRSQINASMP